MRSWITHRCFGWITLIDLIFLLIVNDELVLLLLVMKYVYCEQLP